MSTPDLERTAYTVECFLNALRLEDGLARTSIEECSVRWLAGSVRRKSDCVIYRASTIGCYSGGRVEKSFAVPRVAQTQTLWCDGRSLSVVDGEEFLRQGALIMRGTSGLMLTMPGMAAAGAKEPRDSCGNSNHNNDMGDNG